MKKNVFFLCVCAAFAAAFAPMDLFSCTSWMVFSDLTDNGTNILHKNRDSKVRNITFLMSPAKSKRKWIAIGTVGYTNSGVNSSGLAGAMNSGEICIDPPVSKNKKSTPEILHVILNTCDTAAQAVAKLKELLKAGDYSHGKSGSTFFFMDRNEGYVCEMTARDCSVQRYAGGFTVRANIWQNPGMYQRSRSSIKAHLNSSARAYIALSGLNKLIDQEKKISIPGIMALSRHYLMPEESPEKRSVCFRFTNSASTMEIDRKYPDVLSTMYVAVGHPRHTIFVPIPVCVKKYLPSMETFKWAHASFKRFEKFKLAAPIPAEWVKLEQDSFARYSRAKTEARKLLDAGKRAEAVNLLNETALRIWSEAEKILKI